ncbi:hypothetical protein N9N67_11975 [Bacteriovoracaceae bacterium]|nr:hypothetical protein [Bacteriovoracaceae bacterium]
MKIIILIFISIFSQAYSESQKSYSESVILSQLKISNQMISELDEVELSSITKKLLDIKKMDEVARNHLEVEESKKVKKDVRRAVKAYVRYKKENRKAVRRFKREARKLRRKGELTELDIEDFKAKLSRNKLKLGMHLICAPRTFIEGMYLLIGGGPIHCTDKIGIDNPPMNYKGSSFILGVGLGVFAHVQHFMCMLDTTKVGKYSVNIGLMAKLNVGLGVDASIMIGMNGVCVSAGVGLGAGALVGLGGIAIKKIEE